MIRGELTGAGPSVNFFVAKASQIIGVAFYILNVYIYVTGKST